MKFSTMLALVTRASGFWRRLVSGKQALHEIILLRQVYIHMIRTRPIDETNPNHVQRLSDNFNWWESEVATRLPQAGASDGEISEFRALGNLSHGNILATKLAVLDKIISRLEGR